MSENGNRIILKRCGYTANDVQKSNPNITNSGTKKMGGKDRGVNVGAESQKSLDINVFLINIKNMVLEKPILSESQGRYYGKISIYFEDGKIDHIERYETMK
jgi:hypothetical protein